MELLKSLLMLVSDDLSKVHKIFKNSPTRQLRAAKSLWIQFFDSKYLIPAAASRHMFINWLSDNDVFFFRKNVNRDPP